MCRFVFSLVAMVLMASMAHAQVSLSIEASAASGVSLIDENGLRLVQSFAVGQAFTQQEIAHVETHGTGSQFFIDYIETEVNPPLNQGSLASSMVAIESRGFARNGTLVPTLHSIDANALQPGTQNFRVTMAAAQPTNVELDAWCSGQNYGNAQMSISMTGSGTNSAWAFNQPVGYVSHRVVTPIVVSGVMTIDVAISTEIMPGPGGGLYSDGFDVRWSLTVRPNNPATISYFGTSGSGASLTHLGAPITGQNFTMQIANVSPTAAPYFMIGTRNDFVPFIGVTLPYDLALLGAPGNALLIGSPAPWWVPGNNDPGAPNSLSFYLNPWMSGTYYVQGLIFDASVNAGGFSTTQAARIDF